MSRLTIAVALTIAYFALPACADANAVDQAEREVKREFRYFRIQVFNTFRTDRPEYDRRREAGENALAAWQDAGRQLEQVEPLLTWYRDAKTASQVAMNMPLPPVPHFEQAIAEVEQEDRNQGSTLREVEAQHVNTVREEDKIYHVREVPSRSIHNPYNDAPQQPAPEEGENSPKPATSIWQSVSRAFFKGISQQGSKRESQPASEQLPDDYNPFDPPSR